jgi:peptidyl-prolyl cis-trans isomerase D
MKNLSNKISYLALSLVMGAIIISFLFTGFQGFGSNAGEVASVDGTPITAREYNQALESSKERYAKMFGGKGLTSQQIKMFKIRETTLQGLVSQKHLLNFSTDLKFDAGKADIKEEIKNFDFFKTGGKFDVTKYKSLLQANNLSPAKFEEDIVNQVKNQKLRMLIASNQDSKSLSKEMLKIKNTKIETIAVLFDKEAMTANLKLSNSEVSKFVSDKKNNDLLQGLYKAYESEQKAQKVKKIKAFNSVKTQIATKHLQKTKRVQLTEFNTKLKAEITRAMEDSNISKLNSLKKKFNITFEKKFEMTLFNTKFQSATFTEEDVFGIFKAQDTKKVLTVDSPTTVAMIKATKFIKGEVLDKDLEGEIQFSGQRNARMIESAIIDYKGATSKVVTSASIFL